MEDSAVLVFLSLSLMSWRSASRSFPSGFSSFDAADKTHCELCWNVHEDTVKHEHNHLNAILETVMVNSLALLRGSLCSDRSRGRRVGLRLRWLCFGLSSYSSGSIRWWEGTVDGKALIITAADLRLILMIDNKTLDALYIVLQGTVEHFESDMRRSISILCLNYGAGVRTYLT